LPPTNGVTAYGDPMAQDLAAGFWEAHARRIGKKGGRMTDVAAIVLAAGKGTRMQSHLPKVLHRIGGRSLLGHVLAHLQPLDCARIVIVTAPDMAEVAAEAAPHAIAWQAQQLGTGHAVRMAESVLGQGPARDVLVVYGDTPFVSSATLRQLIEKRRGPDNPAVAVLGMRPADPAGYGRLVLGADGGLVRIVEHKDATAEERAIGLCNSGVMAIDGALVWKLLAGIGNDNAKGEFYLTDIVDAARGMGRAVAFTEAPAAELIGINTRAELAAAESVFQSKMRAAAMAGGATLIDPSSVYFSADTALGRDVVIGPHVWFGPGVVVADGVVIRAFSHLEGAHIAKDAVVGPFARLRPGARIGEGAHVGNFVEIKNASLGGGAKANHLAYLGDADIGAKANIGAGTITCNYDGFEKARTIIGAGAFIGSNSALVAPLEIGAGAIVGAGSVLTANVAADSLAIARVPQVEKPGWAARFRAIKAGLTGKRQ